MTGKPASGRTRAAGSIAALAAVGVALALIGAACGERKEPVGTTVPGAYPLTVQAADEHPVTILRQPRSVLPVSASAAGILEALGLRALVPGASPAGKATGPLKARPLRAIATTPVDLVLGSQVNDANALQNAADSARETLVVVADSSIKDLEHSILEVGLALGVPVKARELVKRIDAKLAAVDKRYGGKNGVSLFVDTGFYIPVADDSFAGEVLRAAGGHNIAGNADPQPYRIKDLLAADPAVYLATQGSGTTLKQLRSTARVKRLTAVKEGRFIVIPPTLLQPSPWVGDNVERLARILHDPDAVAARQRAAEEAATATTGTATTAATTTTASR